MPDNIPTHTSKEVPGNGEAPGNLSLDEAVERLVELYETPPYDVPKRAYLETCLVVHELLDGDEGKLNAGAIYSSLSPYTEREVNSSRGGVGITNISDVHCALVSEREMYSATKYKTGWRTWDAYDTAQLFSTDYGILAELVDEFTSTGALDKLQPHFTPKAGTTTADTASHGNQHRQGIGTTGDTNGPKTGAKRTRKRGGALSAGKSPVPGESDPASEATDGDSEGVESMYESHVGGYVRDRVRGVKAELDVVDEVIEDAYGEHEYRAVGRRMLCHVYHCQTRLNKYGEGVPIGHELLKKVCAEEGVPVAGATELIWKPLEDVGYLNVIDYIYREDDVGRSRRFLLPEQVLSRLTEAVEEDYDKKTRYNLISGSRTRATAQTELTYDGEHSWEERSEFIYKVLKRLRGQKDYVNKEGVEEHLDRMKEKRDEALEQYQEAHRSSVSDDELYEAARDYQRARDRYNQDLRLWSDIVAQGLEETDMKDVYAYETAYEVQEASGRLTMTVGLQNASEEMKAAASKGVPITNVDIKSSQTEALIQEMQMAERMGAPIDVSVLTEYEGKDHLADEHDIDRDAWKRPEHSTKFGAMFNHDTFEAAVGAAKGQVLQRIKDDDGEPQWYKLDRLPHETGEMAWMRAWYNELPTMAQTAQDWADDEEIEYDDPETVYSILQDAYEEMTEQIDRWREWLVDVHWKEKGQHGSGYGYYVENPCSLPFSIHAERLAENGEIDRYSQKAGYATSRLQGLESAFIHALTLIQDDFDYEVLRNEHDGAVVLGDIPDEAIKHARRISGFHRAEVESKPFESAEDSSPCPETSNSASSGSTEAESSGSPGTTTRSPNGARPSPTPSSSTGPPPTSSKNASGSTSTTATSGSSTGHQNGKPIG